MICILCAQPIALWELADDGWSGEPAHGTCAAAAQRAWDEAVERIAAERARTRDKRRARVA